MRSSTALSTSGRVGIGLSLVGAFLYFVMTQSPIDAPQGAYRQRLETSESSSTTMHVEIESGAYSDHSTSESTATITWKE